MYFLNYKEPTYVINLSNKISCHFRRQDLILSDTIYDVYFFFFSESIFRIIFDTQMCVCVCVYIYIYIYIYILYRIKLNPYLLDET